LSGISGNSGGSGVSGTSGSSGTSGLSGASGSSGTSGTAATSGSSGTSGVSGQSSTSGSSGVSGLSGNSCSSGVSGASNVSSISGTSGSNGNNGFSGLSTSSGTSGTFGSNGTNGSSGCTGASGSNGTNGAAGGAGSSGTSGCSGETTCYAIIYTNSCASLVTPCVGHTMVNTGSSASVGGCGNIQCDTTYTLALAGARNCFCVADTYASVQLAGSDNNHNCDCSHNVGAVDCCSLMSGRYNVIVASAASCTGTTANTYQYSYIYASCLACLANYCFSGIIGRCSFAATANSTAYLSNIDKQAGGFTIPHPDPQKTNTYNLVHHFVETPSEGDNLYRFKILVENGFKRFELPDYYKYLNKNTITTISPVGHFGNAYVKVFENENYMEITADTDGEYNVLLLATRKDQDINEVYRGIEVLV
jgi:hypothetical protein